MGIFGVLSASATTLVRMSLDQLAQAASEVIKGHVVSQASQWNAAHTEIVTLTTIAVDSNQKGNTPSTVVVQQLGGTVGHYRVYVPDTVHFFPDAKYMLFLEHVPSSSSNYQIVGMMEGAYRIYSDQRTGQERVINPAGYYFNGASTGSASRVSQSSFSMPLSQFQQQVSSAMAKPVKIPSGTAIPLTISSASFNGTGRILVEGQTTRDLFPSKDVVIPAGSLVDGWGSEASGQWIVHWTSISIRGRQVNFTATSQMPLGSHLQGAALTAMTK